MQCGALIAFCSLKWNSEAHELFLLLRAAANDQPIAILNRVVVAEKNNIYEKKRKTQNNTLNRLLNFFCLLHPSWNKQMMFSCVCALPFSCLAKDPMGWVLRRSLKSRTTHYFLLWFRFSSLGRIFCILCNLFGVLYALKRSRFCWFETIAVCIMKRVEEKTITAQTHTHTHNWNEMQEQ